MNTMMAMNSHLAGPCSKCLSSFRGGRWAWRSVIGLYRPVLEPMGLTHPQYLVMLALWQHEPLSVKDLSRLLQLEPATLSPLLKRLGMDVAELQSLHQALTRVIAAANGARPG